MVNSPLIMKTAEGSRLPVPQLILNWLFCLHLHIQTLGHFLFKGGQRREGTVLGRRNNSGGRWSCIAPLVQNSCYRIPSAHIYSFPPTTFAAADIPYCSPDSPCTAGRERWAGKSRCRGGSSWRRCSDEGQRTSHLSVRPRRLGVESAGPVTPCPRWGRLFLVLLLLKEHHCPAGTHNVLHQGSLQPMIHRAGESRTLFSPTLLFGTSCTLFKKRFPNGGRGWFRARRNCPFKAGVPTLICASPPSSHPLPPTSSFSVWCPLPRLTPSWLPGKGFRHPRGYLRPERLREHREATQKGSKRSRGQGCKDTPQKLARKGGNLNKVKRRPPSGVVGRANWQRRRGGEQ